MRAVSRKKAHYVLTVLGNQYVPLTPTRKQAEFLLSEDLEIFYGGAVGGGKSIALLMAALQYVAIPNYAALILRKTYTDLSLPDALMDVSHQWLDITDAEWHEINKTWTFPSGATLTFGYLKDRTSHARYKSAQFQYVAFDELTEFEEIPYTFLFSRLRRLKGMDIVPLRMRAASNPGGIGHDWVKARFITPNEPLPEGRRFIPAKLDDNPYLDDSYLKSLGMLDEVTYEQLRNGNWAVTLSGGKFKRENFKLLDAAPPPSRAVRYWDLAGTEKGSGPYTVGLLLGEKNGEWYVLDVVRARVESGDDDALVANTAVMDGKQVAIRMEQEPGSSGKKTIHHFAKNVLSGYDFKGIPSTGSKETRARPVAAAVHNRLVNVLIRPWTAAFLTEVVAFPKGAYADQVDAFSGAFNELAIEMADSDRFGYIHRGRVR